MFEHWFIAAIIYLGVLSVMDVRNNMRVDARPNYIMAGLTFGLFPLIDVSLWYVAVALVCVFVMHWVLNRFFSGVLGRADVVAFSWIWLGLMIITPSFFWVFLALLIFCVLVVFAVKKIMHVKRVAFFPSLFMSFVATTILYYLVVL